MARLPVLRDGYAKGVAERMRRYGLMEKCAEFTAAGIELCGRVLENENYPITLRLDCWKLLMDRAYGKPFQQIDMAQTIQEHSLSKIVHEVRWLGPDPEDKSKVVEHTDSV